MDIKYGLNLIQTQKLVLTPELRQAIEILQYNSTELNDLIENEMLDNPLLESNENFDLNDAELRMFVKKYYNTNYYEPINNEEKEDMLNFVPKEDTLREHLIFQLQFTLLEPDKKKIAVFLIENIDDNGYLKYIESVVMKKFKVEPDVIEEIVQTIQTFEPYGVGARDIKECLLIQLYHLESSSEIEKEIVKNHLDNIANNRLMNISKDLNITIFEVQKAVDSIRKLEPKPGRIYSSIKNVRFVKPDVTVLKEKGEYTILVNDFTAPKLKISKYYKELIDKDTIDPKVREYIVGKINMGLKLIKSIEQRRSTIYKVVEAIMEYQKDYFEKGKMYLKTMTLKDIAEKIDMHESTVSRAINGKYMQCGSGLFELKFFFQSGVTSLYGEGISSETIKIYIKDMIEKENTSKPISDQEMSNELNLMGIKISRRTIAKYRDDLFIASSSKRKRFDL